MIPSVSPPVLSPRHSTLQPRNVPQKYSNYEEFHKNLKEEEMKDKFYKSRVSAASRYQALINLPIIIK